MVRSGVVIDFDNQSLDDRMIVTDHRAVQQILMDLLSNGIKFTTGGNVKIKAIFGQFESGKPADLRIKFQVQHPRPKGHRVIPPFLTGCGRRTHAAIFSFCAG
jgi:hypothetical protein